MFVVVGLRGGRDRLQLRPLVRRNAAFRKLFAARSISLVGDTIALVALVLHVQGLRDSGVAVAALLLAQTAPRFFGPVAGAFADRFDRRSIMIASDLLQAAVFIVIAVAIPSLAVLFVLVMVSATAATIFTPASRSVVPMLVEDDDLVAANTWLGLALNLQVAIGPAIAGFLFATLGLRGALVLDALTFVVSALVLTRLPRLPPTTERASQRFFRSVVEGLSYVRDHSIARAVVATLFLGVAFAGVDNVAGVFLARDVLEGGPEGFGLFLSSYGVGMILVSLLLLRSGRAIGPRSLYLLGWLLNGVGSVLTGVAPALAFALLVQFVAGSGNATVNVASDTLVQRSVPSHMLGRVFGLVSTAAYIGGLLSYAAGGVLVDLTSARTVFVLSGTGILAVVGLASIALPRPVADDRRD